MTTVAGVTVAVERPADAPVDPAVCLTHGAGGDLGTRGLVALGRGLAGAGHLTVRCNLPYREAGRRAPPRADRSVAPFAGIVAALDDAVGWDGRWAVGGRSYGGRVASMAVADGLLDAVALVLYSYPLHPPGEPERLRVAHWPAIGVPCLFLQGDRDPLCDLDRLADHLPALGGPAELVVVPGGRHGLAAPGRDEAAVVADLAAGVAAWLRRAAASD